MNVSANVQISQESEKFVMDRNIIQKIPTLKACLLCHSPVCCLGVSPLGIGIKEESNLIGLKLALWSSKKLCIDFD